MTYDAIWLDRRINVLISALVSMIVQVPGLRQGPCPLLRVAKLAPKQLHHHQLLGQVRSCSIVFGASRKVRSALWHTLYPLAEAWMSHVRRSY